MYTIIYIFNSLIGYTKASWVCQCDSTLVQQLEADFKQTLQQQNSLEEWATWLKSVVDNCLKQYRDTPNFTKEARQFLLKWSFYRYILIVKIL